MTGALRRILVIEDDAETAKQIVDFLTTPGYDVALGLSDLDKLLFMEQLPPILGTPCKRYNDEHRQHRFRYQSGSGQYRRLNLAKVLVGGLRAI